MKISLNKANKLRNALEALKIEVPTTGTIRSDASLESIGKVFDETIKLTTNALEKNMDKLHHIFTLRMAIHDKNAHTDLSVLMAQIAHHERGLAYFNSFADSRPNYSRTPSSSLEDILSAMAHAKKLEEADPKLAQAPKSYVVSLMTKEVQEGITSTVKRLKLELEELKEKRNELNHQLTIELPKDMVEFLREYSLVK